MLFEFATSKTHFVFKVYDQIDGVPTWSTLDPALLNLFMGFYDMEWFKSAVGHKTGHYLIYVDNIFYMRLMLKTFS